MAGPYWVEYLVTDSQPEDGFRADYLTVESLCRTLMAVFGSVLPVDPDTRAPITEDDIRRHCSHPRRRTDVSFGRGIIAFGYDPQRSLN